MVYRKVTLKDLDQLTDLFDQYRVFYRKNTDLKNARRFLEERILNGDSEIFVAENSDHILLGFVQLYPLFSSTRMKKLWLLNDLYVNADYRGQGVSVGLINRSKELVRTSGACGMFLETEKSNVIGNRLYPKTGFELNEASNFYEWNEE